MSYAKPLLHEPLSQSNQLHFFNLVTDATWTRNGVGPFVHDVPLNFSTRHFARKLCHVLQARFEDMSEGSESVTQMTVLELAAGSGLLARNVLDILSEDFPDLYKAIKLIIADISQTALDTLEQTKYLDAHKEHVEFRRMDLRSDRIAEGIDAAYSTYCSDSMPSRRIYQQGSNVYEEFSSFCVPQGFMTLDTSVYPPRVVDMIEMETILRRGDLEEVLPFIPRIFEILHKQTQLLPLNETGMETSEQSDIEHFGSTMSRGELVQYNFTHTFREIIRNIMKNLRPGGFVFTTDLGSYVIGQGSPGDTGITYHGNTFSYSVPLQVITSCMDDVRAACFANQYKLAYPDTPDDDPVEAYDVLGQKDPQSSRVSNAFEKHFASSSEQPNIEVDQKRREILVDQGFDVWLKHVANLSPDFTEDFLFNSSHASTCFLQEETSSPGTEDELFVHTLRFAQKAIALAPHIAGHAHLQCASAYCQRGIRRKRRLKRDTPESDADFALAEQHAKQVIALYPNHPTSHIQLASIYGYWERGELAEQAIKDFIRHAHTDQQIFAGLSMLYNFYVSTGQWDKKQEIDEIYVQFGVF